MVNDNTVFTPKEHEQMEYEERMFDKQAAFNLEMQKYETKWASWLKLPVTLILLPVKFVLAIGIGVAIVAGRAVPDKLWEHLK